CRQWRASWHRFPLRFAGFSNLPCRHCGAAISRLSEKHANARGDFGGIVLGGRRLASLRLSGLPSISGSPESLGPAAIDGGKDWECRPVSISAKAMSASKFWTSDYRTPRRHRDAKKESLHARSERVVGVSGCVRAQRLGDQP